MRPNRVVRTIGFRLAALYAGVFGLSVMILFGIVYWITSDALRQQMSVSVNLAVSALTQDFQSGGRPQVVATIERRLSSGLYPETAYLLMDDRGAKVAGNLDPLPPIDGRQELAITRQSTEIARDNDDDDHHLFAFGVTFPDRSFLLVAQDIDRIDEVEETTIEAFGWAFVVTLLFGALGGNVLSIGFLRRIDAINRTSHAIIAGKLSDRVPTRGTGDELDQLALNLNEMLDRVQSLMESLRQVSSDIAHDLRTPLSRLRQRLEGVPLKARNVEDYEVAIEQAISDTDAILATFSAVLRIAQIEAGTRRAGFSTIRLSSVFQSIADAYSAVAEDQGQALVATIEADVEVRGDRELLTQMMANLVENAIRHSPEGAQITLELTNGPAGTLGRVSDTGPGIPSTMRDKVFQRFFRLEQSRSTSGNGLGLALVAAVAEIHGIKVTLADNAPGLIVELNFGPRLVP
ncbi:MAG: ATP-binding protein [Gammaproteobacteria bacterium]